MYGWRFLGILPLLGGFHRIPKLGRVAGSGRSPVGRDGKGNDHLFAGSAAGVVMPATLVLIPEAEPVPAIALWSLERLWISR